MTEELQLADDDENSSDVWNRVLRASLAMPGARINRAAFLRKELSKHFSEEVVKRAVATRPAEAGIPASTIRKIATSSIQWHRTGVTAVSFTTGLPGGWWMVGTIPADMTQFFWHVTVVLQKLAYLYGWPSLADDEHEIDDETLHMFTLFVGVMLGAGAAAKAIGDIGEKFATQVLTRLPRQALTKWGFYRIAKQVARWIGIQLTKRTFARWISKAIPVFSGFLSGGISWVSFSMMSKRLRNHLEALRLAGVDEPIT